MGPNPGADAPGRDTPLRRIHGPHARELGGGIDLTSRSRRGVRSVDGPATPDHKDGPRNTARLVVRRDVPPVVQLTAVGNEVKVASRPTPNIRGVEI